MKERDDGLCIQCGRQACAVHHIQPRWMKGAWAIENMACVCEDCHRVAHNRRARGILVAEMMRRYGYDYEGALYKGLTD